MYRKSNALLGLVMVLSLAATLAACGGTDEDQPRAAMKVVLAPVEEDKAPIESAFSATLAAKETVEVRAKISGYLTERLFQEGAMVKEGDVLYRMDDRDLKAALETAKANTIKAKSAWENDQRTAARYEPLAQTGAVSIQERDVVVSRADESLAQYKAAQADETKAEVNLSYATITASISGYVTRSNVEVGSFVEAGSQLMTTIYNIDPIRAEFSITDKEYSWFLKLQHDNPGQMDKVSFRLELGDERFPYPLPGSLEMADPIIGSATNTIGVRAQFPNPSLKLRPGMYVSVIGNIGERDVLTVPDVAVQDSGSGKAVFTVDAENNLVLVPVEVGPLLNDRRVVRKGLEKGQKVVVEGLVNAHPGMRVEVVEKPATPPDASAKANPESNATPPADNADSTLLYGEPGTEPEPGPDTGAAPGGE